MIFDANCITPLTAETRQSLGLEASPVQLSIRIESESDGSCGGREVADGASCCVVHFTDWVFRGSRGTGPRLPLPNSTLLLILSLHRSIGGCD